MIQDANTLPDALQAGDLKGAQGLITQWADVDKSWLCASGSPVFDDSSHILVQINAIVFLTLNSGADL